MLANINPWGVGGERPLDFSSAYRISFRTLAPSAILTASFRQFLTATEEKVKTKRHWVVCLHRGQLGWEDQLWNRLFRVLSNRSDNYSDRTT